MKTKTSHFYTSILFQNDKSAFNTKGKWNEDASFLLALIMPIHSHTCC